MAAESSEGLLLLDSGMNAIFVNHTAAQILSYPQKVEPYEGLGEFVVRKIRSNLLSEQLTGVPAVVDKFRSGKRIYLCHAFRVDPPANGNSQLSVAILLQRGANGSSSLSHVSDKFRLTAREGEVFKYLLEGLTSKEIATRMGISPNTVKAFLRLIMVKMGVTTRSGILGKAFAPEA